MPMAESLRYVLNVLSKRMSQDHMKLEPWYVKTWHRNDPLQFDLRELPMAVVKPGEERRVDLYVQEDSVVDSIKVYFYPQTINRVKSALDKKKTALQLESDIDTPANMAIDMIERAGRIIRSDPTLGYNDLVPGTTDPLPSDSYVINTQVTGSTFNQAGFIDSGTVYSAELNLEVTRRALWYFRKGDNHLV